MNTQMRQVMLANVEQTNEPPKQFTFDAVYPEDSITETIYADSVFPLVESVSTTITVAYMLIVLYVRFCKATMALSSPMDKPGMIIADATDLSTVQSRLDVVNRSQCKE
jgi:hypothetical protein